MKGVQPYRWQSVAGEAAGGRGRRAIRMAWRSIITSVSGSAEHRKPHFPSLLKALKTSLMFDYDTHKL